jgi:hypothetical protein
MPPSPKNSLPKDARGALRKVLRSLLGGACLFLGVLLGLLALLQGAILALNAAHEGFPVPGIVVRHLFAGAENAGLRADCGSLRFDLSGGVVLENLVVKDLQDREMLRAELVYVHVDPSLARKGILRLDTVLVDDASVILPAYLSDSGADAEVVKGIVAAAAVGEKSVALHFLQAEVGPVRAVLAAPVDFALPEGGAGAPADATGRNVTLQKGLRSLGRAAGYLRAVREPSMAVRPLEGGRYALSLWAAGAEAQGVEILAPEISAVADPSTLFSASLSARSLSGRGVTAEGVFARLEQPLALREVSFAELSGRVTLQAGRVAFHGVEARGVPIRAAREPGRTVLHLAAQLDGLPVSLDAGVEDDGDIQARGSLLTRPDLWLGLASIPVENLNKRLFAKEPYLLDFAAELPRGFTGWKASFRLLGWDIDARGMPVDWLRLRGTVDAQKLDCASVELYSGGSNASGTFHQDLKSLAWRIDVKGLIFPPEIVGPMGRWWLTIWPDFTFGKDRVVADLSLSGNWQNRHYANIIGTVSMRNLLYAGVPIEEGNLWLHAGEGFVELFDLSAQVPSGTLKGSIAWLLKDGEGTNVIFRLNSTLAPADLDKAFGSPMATILPEWTFAKPPAASISGNLHKLAPGVWKREIFAQCVSGPGSWRGIPFHSLKAGIWSRPDGTFIEIPESVMLGGAMKGTVAILGTGAQQTLDIALHLEDTELTPTLTAIRRFGGKEASQEEVGRAGLVRLDFAGKADMKDIASTMLASGSFDVRSAELGRIKVFGALSTLLSSVGFNYGTFSLDSIKSRFRMDNAILRLREAEISGPAIRVAAKGDIRLVDSGLNFEVKVFVLSGQKAGFMNIFGALLSPFGYILELTLKGTLEEPVWRFRIDPRNLFDNGGAVKPPPVAGRTGASPAPAATSVKKKASVPSGKGR